MEKTTYSVITGTGAYVPPTRIGNERFLKSRFYDRHGVKLEKEMSEIIEKFHDITTIAERRYITSDLVTSDIAAMAAAAAIESAGISKEELDYVILAHNFGDIRSDKMQTDICPSLAARVKQKLAIANPSTVAYDLIFGCPGWVQAIIQANYFIKSGDAKKILVIGADVCSRVTDPHDRDSMLYADGAGAVILEARKSDEPVGVLAHASRTDSLSYCEILKMDGSFGENGSTGKGLYLKMDGKKLYQYALETVPQAIKDCLDKAKVHISDIKNLLIHQANGKMDEAILTRLFGLYNITSVPENFMPMTVSWLGNSSVATVPTLLDFLFKGDLENQTVQTGDQLVLASVGAGMNINAVLYKMP